MSEIKLKPCPFCGGEAFSKMRIMREEPHIGVDYVQLQIYCSKCNVGKVKPIDSGRTLDNLQTAMSDLIEKWNTRRDSHE